MGGTVERERESESESERERERERERDGAAVVCNMEHGHYAKKRTTNKSLQPYYAYDMSRFNGIEKNYSLFWCIHNGLQPKKISCGPDMYIISGGMNATWA